MKKKTEGGRDELTAPAEVEGTEEAVTREGQAVLFDGYDDLEAIYAELQGDDLPPDDQLIGDAPRADLVRTVGQYSVVSPIWVRAKKEGEDFYHVIAGRRRIKAARRASRFPIRALVFPSGAKITDVLTLLENQRTDNPASDLVAIESLVMQGASKDEISALVGISPATLEKRLRLLTLNADLRQAFKSGRMQATTAEAAAKLTKEQQKNLADDLSARLEEDPKARITASDVKAVRRAATTSAVAGLPAALFDTPNQPAPSWSEQVEALVNQAIALVPKRQRPVVSCLKETLRVLPPAK